VIGSETTDAVPRGLRPEPNREDASVMRRLTETGRRDPMGQAWEASVVAPLPVRPALTPSQGGLPCVPALPRSASRACDLPAR
jgi:hypothetical protein